MVAGQVLTSCQRQLEGLGCTAVVKPLIAQSLQVHLASTFHAIRLHLQAALAHECRSCCPKCYCRRCKARRAWHSANTTDGPLIEQSTTMLTYTHEIGAFLVDWRSEERQVWIM